VLFRLLDVACLHQGGVATKVRSEADFIIKGKKGSDKLQEVKEEFLEEDKEWDMFRWGVGDVKDERDYMFVLPEEKKSRLQKEDFDDPASLEIGEVPGGELSEFSEMIRKDFYLKFSL